MQHSIRPTLLHGDCLELMRGLSDASIDLVLCDLPYGTTQCKWDSVLPFADLWLQYNRLCRGAIVLTASQPFTSALIMSNPGGFKYCWSWIKTNCSGFANAKKQPLRTVEDVAVFYGRQPTYNPQGVKRLAEPRDRTKETGEFMGRTGFRDGYAQEFTGYPKNVINIPSERGLHPTQKPVALMEYLIRTYTNKGDTVLDNCMGSGTTGVACANTGRRFIGIELDEKYFKIAQRRILQAVGCIADALTPRTARTGSPRDRIYPLAITHVGEKPMSLEEAIKANTEAVNRLCGLIEREAANNEAAREALMGAAQQASGAAQQNAGAAGAGKKDTAKKDEKKGTPAADKKAGADAGQEAAARALAAEKAQQLFDEKGRDVLVDLNARYGVKKAGELQTSQLDDYITEASQILAGDADSAGSDDLI